MSDIDVLAAGCGLRRQSEGGDGGTGWADPERPGSRSSRIRSVFSRIAVMLRNTHFGGALSGIASNFFSQSMSCIFGAKRLASTPSPTSTAANTSAFFMGRS